MNALNLVAIVAVAAASAASPAFASVGDDVRLCRAALAAHPDASQFVAKFERIKGARVRVLRLALTPKEGPRLRAFCTVEKGVVIAVELVAE